MTTVVGLLRPDRPRRVVAEAEAAVVRAELERRLGDVVVDLRVDGAPLGPWRSVATAAWPEQVDVVLDAGLLWTPETPTLTPLFGRTVDDTAAEVRERMLRHLGVLPDGSFDLDEELLAPLERQNVSPTDVWIVARAASAVATGDPAIDGFAQSTLQDPQPVSEKLDAAFDAVTAGVPADVADRAVDRLRAERDAARRDAASADDELRRVRAEVADRLDHLGAENAALRERLERAELGHRLDG